MLRSKRRSSFAFESQTLAYRFATGLMPSTSLRARFRADWVPVVLTVVLGFGIARQSVELTRVLSGTIVKELGRGGFAPESVTVAATSLGLVCVQVLALWALWRRSPWVRVLIWAWAIPSVIAGLWVMSVYVSSGGMSAWSLYVAGGRTAAIIAAAGITYGCVRLDPCSSEDENR